MKKQIYFLVILCVSLSVWAEPEEQIIDFVKVAPITPSTDQDKNLHVTYLSEKLPENPFLSAGFVANHEAVFSVEKFGGVPEKGGRCGYFPEISTSVKVDENPRNIKSAWMFHIATDRDHDFEVPKVEVIENLPFIPADINVKNVLNEFRLFLFTAYNQRSSRDIKIINVQDGISFDITNFEDSDLNAALYGGLWPSLDLERYKFSAGAGEFLLFKLYLDGEGSQKIQIANFLYQKMPDGLILLDKSMDFMNWFWTRSRNSALGKYNSFPWFQGVIYSKSKFYLLFQGYGYESISATLRSLENHKLIDVRVYSDGC